MRNLAITLLICFTSIAGYSQKDSSHKPDDFDKVFTRVEEPPSFPGGQAAFIKYMERNLRLDSVSQYLTKEAQVAMVKFTVDTNGIVSHVSVVNSDKLAAPITAEALRIIRRGPKWIPAKQNGRIVIAQVVQPVTFRVDFAEQ